MRIKGRLARRFALSREQKIERIGEDLVRYGLVSVLVPMGAMKFSEYEANNIKAVLENSPIFSWLYRRIGLQRMARLVGVTELATAGLLALAPRRSRLSAIGSILAMGMFATTLTFLISTPAARTKTTFGPRSATILSDAGQFLLKDLVLFGASVLTLGDSLHQRSLG